MCEEKEVKSFVPDGTFVKTMMDQNLQEEGVGVRATPRKVGDDQNIEAKFKQELYSPAVRDHDGTVEAQQRDTDQLIEDLTLQLDEAQKRYNVLLESAEHYKWLYQYFRVRSRQLSNRRNELTKLNLQLFWKVACYENTRWKRFKRWLKYQWNYDIYNPSGRF